MIRNARIIVSVREFPVPHFPFPESLFLSFHIKVVWNFVLSFYLHFLDQGLVFVFHISFCKVCFFSIQIRNNDMGTILIVEIFSLSSSLGILSKLKFGLYLKFESLPSPANSPLPPVLL